jgi:hypothetical protein
MSDTNPTAGDRVDAAIDAAKAAAADLREKLTVAASGIADDVSAAVNAVSDRIDEIQAAWAARDTE